MKYLLAIILSVTISYSQSVYGSSSGNVLSFSTIVKSPVLKSLKVDLNSDGHSENLKGESIIVLGENEVWVKNTELVSESGDKYFFGNKLKKNETNLVRQVSAEYGYILVYGEGNGGVLVYLAGSNGEKDSDAFSIEL
ncbi:MAG: hypothetical protein IAE93_07690 [Ignavibacteria bacterium]|nr:hypothetical protein [Ignavibacteria bacterium]